MPRTKKPAPATAVTQAPDEEPVPAEVLAQSIATVAEGMRAVFSSPLKIDTVVVLIQAKTGLPRHEIRRVLDSAASLEKDWVKPKI